MFDLVLLLLTFGVLFIAHILRTLLGLRIPDALHFEKARLHRPPDIMAKLFDEADRALCGLGFEQSCWATIHTDPPLPGLAPPLARLYRHPRQPVIARVTPPHSLFPTDRCTVLFLSINADKAFLVTARRIPELFPRLPETRAIQLNADVETTEEQFQAHTSEMVRRDMQWLDRSERKGACAWALTLVNSLERRCTRWAIKRRHVIAMPEGGLAPSTANVLRFTWEFFTGRQHNPPPEREPLPPGRAAYLFSNWRHTSRRPPPLPAQLWLFLISALLFGVIVGLYWDWQFSLLLFLVILFHEAGHWLAMRLLGYGNLQILMLPLVGGATIGQEPRPVATHRAIISLMGPLPGVLAGWILLWVSGVDGGWISNLGIILLLINYLNLLPVVPLDGGQLLKALVPPQRFRLLIGVELLGAGGLLLLAWLSDTLALAAVGLIPLFAAMRLTKRRRILDGLGELRIAPGSEPPPGLVEAIVEGIDRTYKRYRPLAKKAQEIDEILTALQLIPAPPRIAGLILALYFSSFIVPPILVYAVSPSMQAAAETLIDNDISEYTANYERAMKLPMDRLLAELAEAPGATLPQSQPHPAQMILFEPASEQALADAERRLGIHLAGDYRELLAVSNGFVHDWSPDSGNTNYRLLPVEQVDTLRRTMPELLTRLRAGLDGLEGRNGLIVSSRTSRGEHKEVSLAPEELGNALLIGMTSFDEYLLLERQPQAGAGTTLLVIHEQLTGKRYPGLRAYLAEQLAGPRISD